MTITDTPTWRDEQARPADVLATQLASHGAMTVGPLPDELLATFGHRVDSEYVETYWLPIIGPSTLLLARRLAMWTAKGDTVRVPLVPLAAALGLGQGVARHSPVVRTVVRLVAFDLAHATTPGDGPVLTMRSHMAPLTQRQIDRLPLFLAERHRHEIG